MLRMTSHVLYVVVTSWVLILPMVTANNVHESKTLLHRTKRQTVIGRDGKSVVQTKVNCDKIDIVMVLDSSGSIGLQNWYKITNFTANVVEAFNIGRNNVRVGLTWYGNHADVAFFMNDYSNRRDILRKIQEIPWKDQETNTSGAIRLMRNDMFSEVRGDRPDVQNVGVVITDGESNRDADRTIPEANRAKQDGIVMFALGIGSQISMDELRGIANTPADKHVFRVDDFDALQNIEVQLGDAACEAAAECRENADVVFILDSSGSVEASNFNKVKEFVKAVIKEFDIDGGRMRIGLERYGSGEEAIFYLNTYNRKDDILKAVDAVKYTAGTTNTAGALRMLREQMFTGRRGARSRTNRVAVVFTDGGSNSFQETLKMAREARQSGITVLVVAVGNWVNWLEVNEVASDPDANHVFKVDNFNRFGEIQTQLRKVICNDNNMCSPNPCKNGGRCITGVAQFTCECRQRYAGRTCDIRCNSRADVVLALDSSDSIGADKYNKLLNFGKALARSLNLAEYQTRMGVITFANDARVRFQMNRFKTQAQIAEEISFPYMTGRTNTVAALRQIRENMFLPQNGDRNDARNLVVIVTDGHSSDRSATFQQAVELHAKVGAVIVVGVGSPSIHDKIEMEAIATDPDDKNVMLVGGYDTLINMTDSVVRAVCNTENECQSNPCRRGGRCIDGINGFTCECRQGSTGPLCDRAADGALDIIVLVDVSGSIRMERFPIIIAFIRMFVDQLEIRPGRTRLGIGTFADDSRVQFYLDTYDQKEDVLQAIQYIKFRQGKTNTASGLQMLRTQLFDRNRGDRNNAPNIAIVITDGQSNVNTQNTIPQAVLARAQGVYIVVATVGKSRDALEIRAIASDPLEQNVVSVDRYSQLNSMVNRLVQSFTNDQNECQSGPCRNGGTCLDSVGMFSCTCRNDFAGERCQRRCSRQLDIVFVLDASGSVGRGLELEQLLAKRLVRGLNFNSDRSRVGLVTFQSDRKVEFHLNRWANTRSRREEILNTLTFARNARVKGTNTASALSTMRRDMFTSSQGDRSRATNVAIVLTDGQSNINQKGTLREAEAARRAGIRLITVGVGNDVNQAEVQGMASDPRDVYFFSSANQIDNIADRILQQLCT